MHHIQPNGVLRLYADYKTGPGEQCEKDVISSEIGETLILRDGTQYKLNVFQFQYNNAQPKKLKIVGVSANLRLMNINNEYIPHAQ